MNIIIGNFKIEFSLDPFITNISITVCVLNIPQNYIYHASFSKDKLGFCLSNIFQHIPAQVMPMLHIN